MLSWITAANSVLVATLYIDMNPWRIQPIDAYEFFCLQVGGALGSNFLPSRGNRLLKLYDY